MSLPPLSLYVHIPWCIKKCPYCDFNSHESEQIPEQDYLAQLKADWAEELPHALARPLTSIFIGGGTPSLMPPAFYAQLLAHLKNTIAFDPQIEITLEANPGTHEHGLFEGYREAGINRISLGVQSFDPQQLKNLGRVHDQEEAVTAIQAVSKAGFERFNIDLMFGLPDQQIDDALADLAQAQALGPDHISWYQLTIEPNTAFYSQPPRLPEDDMIWEMQQAGIAQLQAADYQRYEVSAFSCLGRESIHNLNYWTFGDYLAIGAGAHGKVTGCDGVPQRYRKTRTPKDYLKRVSPFRTGVQSVEQSELAIEFMMNALRLTKGVDTTLFTERTGLAIDEINETLSELRSKELIMPDRLQCTPAGYDYLNSVVEAFMSS